MNSLINSTFSITYNPTGRQNALSDIKRLLTLRDTAAQNKACGYLIEVISRFKKNSTEKSRMVDYLLENDITIFLCEATSNLDFSLFRSVLACFRLVWCERRFFVEEHAAHASTAVLRALAHYASSGSNTAVDACLHFLCDLLNGISAHQTISPLSNQSAYSVEQLLACMISLAPRINTNSTTTISSALVLHSLISYQPPSLTLRGNTATSLVEVLDKWLALLLDALNHSMLVGGDNFGILFMVLCELGIDILRLIKIVCKENKGDFIQTILADAQDVNVLRQCADQMTNSIRQVISELAVFTKENQDQISTESYGVFLKFLLNVFYDSTKDEQLNEFCDMLFAKGYLIMLPQAHITRNDTTVRKISTLVLGEMLKVLADKYLHVTENGDEEYHRVIHTGLVELQHGIEKPQVIGYQLQKTQPYSLLIYIYFYCQSSDNPEDATAPLLPYLVEHIQRLPRAFKPPPYIKKALWLVFAMSAISNDSLKSLDERVHLEKATNRLMDMLHPDPSIYYTHNPALLLWAFTSQRISNFVRLKVLSQWLKIEDSLPTDLTTNPLVWELLLDVLTQSKVNSISENCMAALQLCLEDGDDDLRQDFASLIWSMLPEILSKALVEHDCNFETNICHLLELATLLTPTELDHTIYLKVAVLITVIFSKNNTDSFKEDSRLQFEYENLKLSLYLLRLSHNQNDNRVLMTFINRCGYLSNVLAASNSADDKVACAALQLLSCVVHYYSRNNCQPNTVLQIHTHLIIKSLRRESFNQRGALLMQLVYMVLDAGVHTPMVLTYDVDAQTSATQQCNALRAMMFRIQLVLCSRDSENQSTTGWRTLSALFKHAIVFKNDPKLIATLTSQPWTHILIQFQLTQKLLEDFLIFVQNWLTLLQITIKKYQEQKKTSMCRHSLTIKTLMSLRKNISVENELKESKQKILLIVKDILEDNGIKFK